MKKLTLLLLLTLSFTAYGQTDWVYLEDSIPIGYKNLYLVTELQKNDSKEYYDSFECYEWELEEESLRNIITEMDTAINSNDLYVSCYQYSCNYTGLISDGKKEYEIIIHGGSQIYLGIEPNNTGITFIHRKASDLFISVCNCCE